MKKVTFEIIGRFAIFCLAASGIRTMNNFLGQKWMEYILLIVYLILGLIWVLLPMDEVREIKKNDI